MSTATKEAKPRQEKSQAIVLKERADFIEKQLRRQEIAEAIKALLPRGMEVDRFLSMAMTAVRMTPQLAFCEPSSLVKSILTIAQLGLELDRTLGQACIVPYRSGRDGGVLVAQPQVMYRGYITLAHRGGSIAKISAEVVFSKDTFNVSLGTNRGIHHMPSVEEDRGDMIGAYATARFKDGSTDFEHLTRSQILKIRKSAKGADAPDSPWQTHPEEMWRKTAIRRLCKYLPLSPDDYLLVRAVVVDEAAEVGKPIEHPGIPAALLPAITEEPPPKGEIIHDDERPTQEEPPLVPKAEIPPFEPPAKEDKTSFVIRCTWNTDRKTALISGHTDFVAERMRKVYGAHFDKELGGYILVGSWVPDLEEWCKGKEIQFEEQ